MSEQRFTPSEVKIIEMLAPIQAAQKFTIERLDKINGSVARHEKELREQGISLEGHRHDSQALQQSRGVWRAAVVVAGIVSAVVTGVGMWVVR